MVLLPNLGSPIASRTGAIYRLAETPTGWKLVNRKGQQYTARGLYQFVRLSGSTLVCRRGEHVHMSRARPVEYAGQVRFGYNRSTRGRLRFWTNGSGHYLPPASMIRQAGFPAALFVEATFD